MTPLAAVVGGVLAGVVGTVCLDAVNYLKYRSTGGKDGPLKWEFPQVGKRLIEGFTQRELPDRWASPVSTVMHWSYGSGWGALYGILAGSLRRPNPLYGLPFGAVIWVSDYVLLPEAGLYKPIWDYDAKTLANDLSAHLAYGAGTGTTFWLITKIWR
jgi:uncharacterized membrane protein YagU involved in acid resistance